MIISAGLTPAWQTIMRFDAVRPGEVNRAREVHHFASGKVLNVAVALSHLGADCKAIAVVGGPTKDSIDCELSALGISRHWVVSRHATRSCVTVLDGNGDVTELVENSRPVTTDEIDEFLAVLAHDAEHARAVVLTGSLPPDTPSDVYERALRGVHCPVVFDSRGPELLAALVHKPTLVKPNREELAMTVGHELPTDADVWQAMQDLHDRGASWVLVSNGPLPAWLLGSEGRFEISPPPIETVVNPIGSGDCLAAGIAWGLAQGKPMLDCVKLGIAAAAENVTHLLAGRFAPSAVEKRVSQIRVNAL